MPTATQLKAGDPRGQYDTIAVANTASQTITVVAAKTKLTPAGTSSGVDTVNSALPVIRLQCGSAAGGVNIDIEDASGNLDLGGSDVTLEGGEAVILERRVASDNSISYALQQIIRN